jgi:ribonucleotide reductase alpha subunit
MSDSINSIYDVSKDIANMSKYAGGTGLNLSHIRAYGSIIDSSGSIASGVTYPLMNKINADKGYTMREGGKRNGAYSTYLPVWHSDFIEFIRLPRHTGNAHQVKDIKMAAWISDLFMKITKQELAGEDVVWYQFSPDNADILSSTYGADFETNYWRLVDEKKYTKTVKPSVIWIEIFKTIAQRGYPYILFKDHINNRSNLSHDMTIETSNLCAEITIPCSTTSYGTCNLGCVALASYVIPDETADNAGKVRMDWNSMISAVRTLTRGLGKVMEISYVPAIQCKVSNNRYRPIGIGIMRCLNIHGMIFGHMN